MKHKEYIRSEFTFLVSLLKDILLLPITLIAVIARTKSAKELLAPFKNIYLYFTEIKFTSLLITLNILFFIGAQFLLGSGFLSEEVFARYFIWYPTNLLNGRWVSFIGSLFMHATPMHLLSNMIALFIFGRVVEKHFTPLKAALIYFGSGCSAHLFTTIIYLSVGSNVGGLGASGAIMGLVSTAILIRPFYISFNALIPLPIMVLGWLTLFADITGLLTQKNDGIGHLAHLGGFLAIALLVFFLDKKEKEKIKKGLVINIVSFLVFIGILFALRFYAISVPFLNTSLGT